MLLPGFSGGAGWSMVSTGLTQEDAERFAETFLFPVQARPTEPPEGNEEP
jgi:hypothetical protein